MASMIDSPLFGGSFTTEEMRKVWSDETTVQKWLDVEAALARAEGKLGIIPKKHAQEITRKARVEFIDMEEMKRQLVYTHHPIMALIRGFQQACSPQAWEFIHWGATTQDIMDTGAVLQLRDANDLVVRDLRRSFVFWRRFPGSTRTPSRPDEPTGSTPCRSPSGTKWRYGPRRSNGTSSGSKSSLPACFRASLPERWGRSHRSAPLGSSCRSSCSPTSAWPYRRLPGTWPGIRWPRSSSCTP